ncbi:hypothetical protein MKD41_00825 [Lutibacter sp. A64]|nr:hypothetical protein [Lutibacter sp. A64]UMB54035.1 hypothetical protein MKD41_00825 [Lutibacter sp. A64]
MKLYMGDILKNIPQDSHRVYLVGSFGGAMRILFNNIRPEKYAGVIVYGG